MSEATKTKKKLSIPVKLAIALVLGAIAGLVFKEKASYVAFIGSLFIRLLKMCVYPLVLFSIIAGIANVADIAKLKKIGGQFLLYTFITSAVAGVLGCLAITISGAGTGLVLQATVDSSVQQLNMVDSIVGWVPDNVSASLANGTLVQIIVFAIFFGVMITKMRKNANTVDMVAMVVEGCNLIMQRMVATVMTVAPYGVFCLIANLVGTTGVQNLKEIFTMVLSLWGASLVHMLIVLPLLLRFFGRVKPFKFFKNIVPVTKDEYFDYKEKYESRIADLAVEMEQLEDGLRTMDTQIEQHRALEQDAAQIKTDRALTGALIERLIDRIEVSHDKQITVRYRFQSEFETYAEVLEQCRNM